MTPEKKVKWVEVWKIGSLYKVFCVTLSWVESIMCFAFCCAFKAIVLHQFQRYPYNLKNESIISLDDILIIYGGPQSLCLSIIR